MKILLVDDSRFVLNFLQKQLETMISGCETDTAGDGMSGLERYHEFQPDLIVTDLLMPIMTGQELIREIRKADAATRIIVVSADVQKATREEVEAMGVSGFVGKPVNAEKVKELVRLAMEE